MQDLQPWHPRSLFTKFFDEVVRTLAPKPVATRPGMAGEGNRRPQHHFKAHIGNGKAGCFAGFFTMQKHYIYNAWGNTGLGSCDPGGVGWEDHFGFEKKSFHKSTVFVASRSLWPHVLEKFCPNCVSVWGFKN